MDAVWVRRTEKLVSFIASREALHGLAVRDAVWTGLELPAYLPSNDVPTLQRVSDQHQAHGLEA